MRHHNKNKKFGRKKDERRALLRSLAGALVRDGKIMTTEAKAKALRPFIEKLVTRARKGDVSARRILVSRLGSEEAARKLVSEIAPRFKDVPGGYTRIVKIAPRRSDAARMAVIEFVSSENK